MKMRHKKMARCAFRRVGSTACLGLSGIIGADEIASGAFFWKHPLYPAMERWVRTFRSVR